MRKSIFSFALPDAVVTELPSSSSASLASGQKRTLSPPQQRPEEISMLKCYDSVTDGSVSRWSFHSACVDPTAPKDAPHRRNIVVRTYVFFDE